MSPPECPHLSCRPPQCAVVQGGGKITYNVIKTRLGDLLYKLRCTRQGVFQAGVVLLHKLRCGTNSAGGAGGEVCCEALALSCLCPSAVAH